MEPYLLTRKQAAERYNIGQSEFDKLYLRYRDFPVLRKGKKVLIHRELADRWFTERLHESIE